MDFNKRFFVLSLELFSHTIVNLNLNSMKKILQWNLVFTVCLSLLAGTAMAQERAISGRVMSTEDGTPIPGVNVVVKGTTNGTTTDANGNYTLSVPASGGTLVFSFIGLKTDEVAIGEKTVIDLSMGLDVTQLSEVVVVGYGTQERRKLTTAVSSVQGEKISKLATSNFVEQLAGRAAGVQINTNTGIIGQAPSVIIRGIASITSGAQPLYVVDGVPMTTGNQSGVTPSNPLADINPSDIESYDILKDGAATAIYGSRAAAGVILITTKRGTKNKGKAKVDFTTTFGFAQPVKTFDLANADEFVTIANAKLANAGTPAAAANDPNNPTSGETDWQDFLLRNGKFVNYNINLSGATENTNYYFSVGYQDQEGQVRTNDFNRLTVRANADHRVNKFFKFGNSLQFARTNTQGLNTGTNALSGNISGGIRAFPNVTIYDPTNPTGYNLSSDGQSLGPGANTRAITSSWTNQAFVQDNNYFRAKGDRLLANIYGQIDIIDGLSIKTLFGVDYLGNKDFQKNDPRHGDGRGANGIVFNQYRNVTVWTWQNTIQYNKDFGNHGIDFVGGLEYQKTTVESFSGQGTSFSDRYFMENGLIGGTFANQFAGGTFAENAIESTFGRLNYSFKDKYLIGVSVRRDGLSSLAPKNRYGVFPGYSLGYRVSEEDFFKNSGVTDILNDLKIRASYSVTGNTNIGFFPYAGLFGAAKYGTQNGVGFTQAGNDDLKWETSNKTNIGADFGFLNNRITLGLDWFKNDVNGLILEVPYPVSLGIPNPNTPNVIPQNIGAVQNSGLEFTVNANALTAGDFSWNINANFTSIKNEVTKTFLNTAGVYADVLGPNLNYQISARVGEPLNSLYGYTYSGVNSANGNPMYEKGNGQIVQRNVGTGTYSFYDPANPTVETNTVGAALNPADIAAGGDRQILGRTLPKWYGGLTNTFAYKGLSLEIFLRFSGGNLIYNQTRQDVLLNMDFTNSSAELLDSWSPENPESSLPKMYLLSNSFVNQAGVATTRFIEKGDFMRVQNIVLSYTVPTRVFGDGELKGMNIRIFGQIQNALTFTKYSGLDPELGILNNGINTGIDNNVNPIGRTFTMGVNIGL